MKKCDLMNHLKEGAPTDHLYCSWHKNEKCERISCPYQLPEKTEREKLIEEAEKLLIISVARLNQEGNLRCMIERLIAELKKDVKDA